MCLLVFSIGKIFKFDLEEMMVGIIAAIGGPPTAAALSISMGWKKNGRSRCTGRSLRLHHR